ncbi:MAG: hypothetical protein PHC85_00380 [Candidatus Pacebacteria bacterium]|nr:hypothetical protein [Candidatus Paceibacterota bacterium]
MDDKKHFICPVCGVLSDEPGVCKTGGCERENMPLKECRCGNGEEHKKAVAKGGCDCGDSGCCSCCG